MKSSYDGKDEDEWLDITKELIDEHPLSNGEIIEVIFKAWKGIFTTSIGGVLEIGIDIDLTPQTIGNLMGVLIPHHLSERYPSLWKREEEKNDKDAVHIPDDFYSFEIKTSSHPNRIFGNRSYAQPPSEREGKSKDGYYLAINWSKVSKSTDKPYIRKIRRGWLDHSDWKPQKSPTGQQASVRSNARKYKLLEIFSK